MITPYIKLFGRSYLSGRRLKSPALTFLVLRDVLVGPFFGKISPSLPKREEINEICVCKLDHLGDLLMLTPFLAALRRSVPNAQVTLVVGSWCLGLADILQRGGLIDRYLCYTAFTLDKRKRFKLARLTTSFFELALHRDCSGLTASIFSSICGLTSLAPGCLPFFPEQRCE